MKINKCQSRLLCALLMNVLLFDVAHAQSSSEIARKAMPSVVVVIAKRNRKATSSYSYGSGFYVHKDVIATNYHVIKQASSLYIKAIGQKTFYSVKGIVAIDISRDLALLKVTEMEGNPLNFGNSEKASVGDEIYTIGNPEGLEGTFSMGVVSAIRKISGNSYIQISAAASHGSSGGPVLSKQGEVIGIVRSSLITGQNLNFAIPSSDLLALMSKNGLTSNLDSQITKDESESLRDQEVKIGSQPSINSSKPHVATGDKSINQRPIQSEVSERQEDNKSTDYINIDLNQVDQIINYSELHYKNGEQAYARTNYLLARREFDKAIDIILMASADARKSYRLRIYYRSLIEKINVYQTTRPEHFGEQKQP